MDNRCTGIAEIIEILARRRRLLNEILGDSPRGRDPYTEGLRDGIEEALIAVGQLVRLAVCPE